MENLNQKLEAFAEGMFERVDCDSLTAIRAAQQALMAGHDASLEVGKGDLAPDFALSDQDGRQVSLRELLARGPVVLHFFRGGWCPFCTLTLRAMNCIDGKLRKLGASQIAVSPQPAENLRTMAERNGLAIPLLSDPGLEVIGRYGLGWELSDELRAIYLRLGRCLPQGYGAPTRLLPIPASYVIDRTGRVVAAHVDPKAYHRMEPEAVLEAVRGLADTSGKMAVLQSADSIL